MTSATIGVAARGLVPLPDPPCQTPKKQHSAAFYFFLIHQNQSINPRCNTKFQSACYSNVKTLTATRLVICIATQRILCGESALHRRLTFLPPTITLAPGTTDNKGRFCPTIQPYQHTK